MEERDRLGAGGRHDSFVRLIFVFGSVGGGFNFSVQKQVVANPFGIAEYIIEHFVSRLSGLQFIKITRRVQLGEGYWAFGAFHFDRAFNYCESIHQERRKAREIGRQVQVNLTTFYMSA